MKTRKTTITKDIEYGVNYVLHGMERAYLLRLADKHDVDVNKLVVGMSDDRLLIQIYDPELDIEWKTLEIVKWD